ncbi:MAG TPA: acyltransferase family protein, partial [Mycobacteriales bacterium]|nr:acyltransferase family protein [Mycobacteriales bacterium]
VIVSRASVGGAGMSSPHRPARVDAGAGGRLRALDGVRGLAVLFFHAGMPWAHGGFLGVDTFFVLSGYLITVLLLRESRATGRVSLRRFWARRARRLLPALLLVLAALAAYATTLPTEARPRLRGDALATLGYVANWRFVVQAEDYFAHTGPPSPLRHTWSLGVEEQFYLLWPLLFLVALRLRRPRAAVVALATLGTAASAVLMARMADAGVSVPRLYYGTDTRISSLLIGCLLAAVLGRFPGERPLRHASVRALTALAALAGVAVTGVLWVTADVERLWRGGFVVAAVATAALVAGVVLDPGGPVGRLLAAPPLAALGVISYGVYLWHWPVYLVVNGERTGLVGVSLLGARVAVTLLVAVASFLLVERPVLRGALRSWRALVVPPAAVGAVSAAMVVVTLPLPLPQVVPWRTPPSPSLSARAPASGAPASGAPASGAPVAPSPASTGGAAVGTSGRVLVLGDSVALTLGYGLQQVADEHGMAVTDRGILGCGLLPDGTYRYVGEVHSTPPECAEMPARWRADLDTYDPDVVLLLVGRWEVMDRVEDGRWVQVGDPAYDARLAAELDDAVRLLSARGAAVGLLTAPYYHRAERPDGGLWPEDDPARVDRWNALVRDAAARHPGVAHVVDLGARTTGEPGVYRNHLDGIELRYDGVHFTGRAARYLGRWILPQVAGWPRPGGG